MGKNKKQGSINKPLETTQKIGKKSKPKNKYTISIEAQQEQQLQKEYDDIGNAKNIQGANHFQEFSQKQDCQPQQMNQEYLTNQDIIVYCNDQLSLASLIKGNTYKLWNNSNKRMEIVVIYGVLDHNGKIYEKSQKNPKNSKIELQMNSSITIVCKDSPSVLQPEQGIATIQEHCPTPNLSQLKQKLTNNLGALVIVKSGKIDITSIAECPWSKLKIAEIMTKNCEATLLLGQKNSGKSTLCEYLLNLIRYQAHQLETKQLCVIDCDLGQNQNYPASISLKYIKNQPSFDQQYQEHNISIWVGQMTPLNQVHTYLKAIDYLYRIYRQRYFASNLIINTMGYLTGIGQFMFYEIYRITKPHHTLIMSNESKKDNQTNNIKKNIESGEYLKKLYFSQHQQIHNEEPQKTSTKFIHYNNKFASNKVQISKFASLIEPTLKPLQSYEELLQLILNKKLKKVINYEIYRQDRQGTIRHVQWAQKSEIDMNLVVIGSLIKKDLVEIKGLGYGWKSHVYCCEETYGKLDTITPIALISQGIDFDKNFYQISQAKMIQMEQSVGRIPFMMPNTKLLGNKGMRNYGNKNQSNRKIEK